MIGATRSRWCWRASAPADVALPYFPEPALAVHKAGDEWLHTRKRRLDFFMMAAPHDISRNLLEQTFYYYDDEYPGQHAHVRINVHMTKAAGDLAAGALEYRVRVLDSKFCLIPKGAFIIVICYLFLQGTNGVRGTFGTRYLLSLLIAI